MAGADRVKAPCSATASEPATSDLVNLALNLFSQGVDPELDIGNIDELRRVTEYATASRSAPGIPT